MNIGFRHLIAENIGMQLGAKKVLSLKSDRCFRIKGEQESWLLKFFIGDRAITSKINEEIFLNTYGRLLNYQTASPLVVDNKLILFQADGQKMQWQLYPWIFSNGKIKGAKINSLINYLSQIIEKLSEFTVPLDTTNCSFFWGSPIMVITDLISRFSLKNNNEIDFIEKQILPKLARCNLWDLPDLVWCHGDMKLSNVIRASDTVYQLVDWEAIHLDIPYYDLVYFFIEDYMRFELKSFQFNRCWDEYISCFPRTFYGEKVRSLSFNDAKMIALAIVAFQVTMLIARGNKPMHDCYLKGKISTLHQLYKGGNLRI